MTPYVIMTTAAVATVTAIEAEAATATTKTEAAQRRGRGKRNAHDVSYLPKRSLQMDLMKKNQK